MRRTLHDYVIEKSDLYWSDKVDLNDFIGNTENFAKLTNRAPRLGDFVPCDEDGNVLEEPYRYRDGFTSKETAIQNKEDWNKFHQAQSRVIFKGDWEVDYFSNDSTWIESDNLGIIIRFTAKGEVEYKGGTINRIEDLPREIEFIEGVI